MDTLMKSDIFFVVTTVVVTLIGIGLIVFTVYAILFIRELLAISRKVKEESNRIAQDLEQLRLNVKSEGFKWRHAVSFVSALWGRRTGRRARHVKSDNE